MILAEIADKMPTIPQMWFWWGLIGIVLAMVGSINRRVAIVAFGIGILISIVLGFNAYHIVFIEPDISNSVQTELGTIWIANSLLSTFCPALFVGVVIVWNWKEKKTA